MSNVVNIADRRQPKSVDPIWYFDLRAWNTPNGVEGQITDSNTDDGLSPAERLRGIASALDYLSYLLIQQAEQIEEGPHGTIIAKVSLFANSLIRIRVNDDLVQTEAQEEWVREQLEHAKDLVAEKRRPGGSS